MEDFLIAILRSGTPLIYVTLAGVIAQRTGIWHLGLEGLMIVGACAAILGIVLTQSIWLALLSAIIVCVIGSILFWFVVEKLKANQIIAGLGLTGLGLGGTALAVQSIFGTQAAISAPLGFRVSVWPSVLLAPFQSLFFSCLLLHSRCGSLCGVLALDCAWLPPVNIPSPHEASV